MGKLDADKAHKGHLIHVAQLEKTNSSTIVQTVQEALSKCIILYFYAIFNVRYWQHRNLVPSEATVYFYLVVFVVGILWQGAPNTSGRLLLLVTDSVAYMLSAGKTLKDIYPKLIHETCLAHGLHRVAEAVREQHPQVNKLISVGKKIFLKAPSRVAVFRKHLPGVPLPPEPVITRWGTWLSAASYYVKHFEGFKRVVKELEDDSASVKTAKALVEIPTLFPQLLFVESNFKDIPGIIESFQSESVELRTSVEKMKSISDTVYPGATGKKIEEKIKAVLGRNCGWEEVNNIVAILSGEEATMKEGWEAADVLAMKYAPATSADVERTFSKMKYLLSDRRLGFSMESVSAHLMLFFNNNKI